MTTSTVSVPLCLKRFFSEYLPQQRNCSLHTMRSYRDALRLFLLHLQKNKKADADLLAVEDLSAQNIMDFLNALQETRNNGNGTRNARLAAIRCFVKYILLVEPTLSSDLQAVFAIPAKRTTRPVLDFLTREEIQAVLNAPNADSWSGRRDRALLAAMYNTGARVSEIVGAMVSDVRLRPGGTLRLRGKGRKERVLPLWRHTVKLLAKWIEGNQLGEGQPLFPNARRAPMTRSGVEKRLRQAIQRACEQCPSLKGKRISPHTLRHTTAMHLLQSGVDITLIAMWLGHESIETTHVYMTTDLDMKEQALKALQSPGAGNFRFRPTGGLLTFLESL